MENIPQLLRPFHPIIQSLAHEGIELNQELSQWRQDYAGSTMRETAYTQLALIEFHALALFLCQTYSYYQCWSDLTIPSLTKDRAEFHVRAIIDLAGMIEAAPHVPGVLLLFALRTAGVHAIDVALMRMVTQQLDLIYREGFIVSERIKLDLQEFWEDRQRLNDVQLLQDY